MTVDNIALFNKLSSVEGITPAEINALRESLGINVYDEINTHLQSIDANELLDYITILFHAAAISRDGTALALDLGEDSDYSKFVETYKLFDLDAQKLINLALKQQLKPKRNRVAKESVATIENNGVEKIGTPRPF